MKKTLYLLTIGLFSLMVFSCTPQAVADDGTNTQACCGDNMHFPPPPPPPPPPNGGIGG